MCNDCTQEHEQTKHAQAYKHRHEHTSTGTNAHHWLILGSSLTRAHKRLALLGGCQGDPGTSSPWVPPPPPYHHCPCPCGMGCHPARAKGCPHHLHQHLGAATHELRACQEQQFSLVHLPRLCILMHECMCTLTSLSRQKLKTERHTRFEAQHSSILTSRCTEALSYYPT
eukprot:1161934-Pelagomonas_calceolata.AAC.2